MPNWMSYRGEGGSLSFHIPPVFHGLVLWFASRPFADPLNLIIIIIRNKSNGIQLFNEPRTPETEGWIRYISRSEMAMEDYCADDELELHIYSQPSTLAVYEGRRLQPVHIKECGVHVITGKSDSFEEFEVERNTVMPSPPPYHLLPHPHCGSIIASTPKQWSDYLFSKLYKYNLNLTLAGKNKYFI
jgi:leucine-rich repeat protein SHOC2